MSSIFDALRKLEEEKSDRKSPEEGGDRPKPPPGNGGRFRGFRWLAIILVVVAGAAYYWLGGDGEAPAPDQAAPPIVDERPAEEAAPVAAAESATDPGPEVPVAGKNTGGPEGGLTIPTNIMTEEQRRAMEKVRDRIAKLNSGEYESADEATPPPPDPVAVAPEDRPTPEKLAKQIRAKVEAAAGRPAAPLTPPAPVSPPAAREPLPEAAPPPAAPGNAAVPAVAAPPEAPEKPAPAMKEPAPAPVPSRQAPAPAESNQAVAVAEPPARKVALADKEEEEERADQIPMVKKEVPMLLVTEVTYHRHADQRSARIRLDGTESRTLREGDRYQGLVVKEIMPGAVTVEAGGRDVVVGVGESLSFTVNAPSFH